MSRIANENWLHRNQQRIFEVLLFSSIVALGIGSRFWLQDYPNFKPIAALALFAGYYFRQLWVGLGAMLSMMLVSDQFLGTYEWQIALSVYAALTIAVILGWQLSRWIDRRSINWRMFGRRTSGFAFSALVMSTVFFLLTNLATWACWYPTNWTGLQACFVAAIPFFRYTLMGDLFFTTGIVIVYQTGLLAIAAYRARPAGGWVRH